MASQAEPARAARREPDFEPPPWFTGRADRRLAGRAVAAWNEARDGCQVPTTAAIAQIVGGFSANAVLLLDGHGAIAVAEVGAAVAAAFGLRAGGTAGALAVRLVAAATRSAVTRTPFDFEGGFSRRAEGPATLLTRGVVLPFADAGGRVVAALAVMTWTEPLSPFASNRLLTEFRRAGRAIPRPATAEIFPFIRR